MTKEEFDSLIEEQRKKGFSDEDIVKIFALMFRDGKIDRETIEGILEGAGYEISPEFKEMSDEEFKEKILISDDEGGEKAPEADKAEVEEKSEEFKEKREERKEAKEEDEKEDSEEDERKRAMRLMNLQED